MRLAPATRNCLTLFLLWLAVYATFTLFLPPLLDDADSVHAEVAREMLLRHDWVTLYANGIRYLEKAPILYWSMALSFRLLGVSTAAARLPLALTVLALALLMEAFARRAFASARAGLYAGLLFLSSFGIFIFTRITIPDADVCLWLTLALYAFWTTEQAGQQPPAPGAPSLAASSRRVGLQVLNSPVPLRPSILFSTACALNVLTKGLIGLVFPLAIVGLYLLLTRGPAGAIRRLRQLHPLASLLIFFAIAAPWHLLIGLANPTQGHPAPITFANHHWQVPLPTDGNVHGWFWFYFVNEHLLRYLNLRVPRDYDTVPLALFWGLLIIWLMPWSAFLYPALKRVPLLTALAQRPLLRRSVRRLLHSRISRLFPPRLRVRLQACHTPSLSDAALPDGGRLSPKPLQYPSHESRHSMAEAGRHPQPPPQASSLRAGSSPDSLSPLQKTNLLLGLWALTPMLFFSLSTRQEYYVLPSLPALVLLLAAYLADAAVWNDAAEVTPSPTQVASSGLTFVHETTGDSQFLRVYRAGVAASRIATFLLATGTLLAASILFFLAQTRSPAPDTDLATLLHQNPGDYALSFGHFLDLNAQALGLFRLPLAVTAAALFLGPLAHWLLRRRSRPHSATLALAAATFLFLLAAHLGLQTFSPVLSSKKLADAIAPQLHRQDLIVLHGEYEAGSTLGFYLHRADLHLLEGRSSNLWYGSFFPDAPKIFETRQSLARKWPGPQRIFLWQDPSDPDRPILQLPAPTYLIARSGGKEILSNQPNR